MNVLHRRVVALASALLAASIASQAAIVRVDPALGDDAYDGSSWIPDAEFGAGPMKSIQAAVDAVSGAGGGDVWLKKGTHVLANTQTVSTFDGIGVAMASNVAVRGGFDGTELDASEREALDAAQTVVDGSAAQAGQPAFHVLYYDNRTNTLLEGVTVTGGKAPDVASAAGSGGGILMRSCGPTNEIRDCRFVGNRADFSSASGGGAAYLTQSSPTFRRCLFAANSAEGRFGGAIHQSSSNVQLRLEDCIFVGNRAGRGGALYLSAQNTVATVDRCVFAGNEGTDYAGGIYAVAQVTLHATNSLFAGNRGLDGGAIFVNDGVHLTTTGCTFVRNASDLGSAIANGSFFSFPSPEPAIVRLRNSIMAGGAGVAIHEHRSDLDVAEITNCLLFQNVPADIRDENTTNVTGVAAIEALPDGAYAGNTDADPQFPAAVSGTWTDVSLAGHVLTLADATAPFAPGAFAGRYLRPSTTRPFVFAVISNTADTVTVLADADIAGSFAAGQTYEILDFHVTTGSGAVDAGADFSAQVPPPPTNDLDGRRRPIGAAYDIGAHEATFDTSIIVATTPNPSKLGQFVDIVATIDGDAPTGTVEFFSDGTSLGSGAIEGVQAQIAVGTLAVGDREIHAEYGGDSANEPATSPTVVHAVEAAPPEGFAIR